MHISSALIPQSQFHMGAWLIQVEQPSWYYFMKKKNTNLISNDHFMESVDAPLKDLVHFLHTQQVPTTPSCSGHFRSREEYKKVFASLVKDKETIHHEGLDLKDIETGKIYHYQDKNYRLPWQEEEFLDRIMSYQHKGVVGMRLGHKRSIKKQILSLEFSGVKFEEKENIVLILLEKNSEASNIRTWAEITEAIQSIFSTALQEV